MIDTVMQELIAEGKEQLLAHPDADQVIKYVLCMWSDGSIEIPSMHFRNLLLDASAENAQAVIILQGTDGISCKKLITCMPNEK